MTATEKNLKAAFAGESQANRKYLAYAKKADEEGLHQVAKLFRAVAEAETIHALTHLKVMKGIGTTAENLKEAISGENYEHTSMYPEFIEAARADGDKEALRSFSWANAVEKIHEEKYKAAAEAVSSGNDLPAKKLYVCPLCGNVEEDEPPEKCRVCGAPGSSFKEVM
ncbi:MAG TPA: rubrerythrin family protein [Methanomassiliicoccaceae archaeon]|jgi:rubrerythrin|nr:rubrerythrin family protein [Methanomassiliicoccaceae archaeon]HQA21627.1 rubrerythrin family protein [Methanomassiliicoccaceae archaeon]HQD88633.1 rubrerythrin family protein [Methanomassiliicoccaceae archaeon]